MLDVVRPMQLRRYHQINMTDLISSYSRLGLRVLVLCLGLASIAHAQTQKRQVTLEWIFGPEGRSVGSLPPTAWLDDGTLILLDNRRPAPERTFERLDPSSGRSQPLVDQTRALTDLRSVVKDLNATALPWPIAFDGSGRSALYIFNGDVFVLEFSNSRFRRLTSTATEEKSASFSPNGRRIAYVRDNDLYFFDLDGNRETRLTRDGSETVLNGTLSWVYWEEIFGRRDIGYWWSPDSKAIA